jgi:hypothetical protein
MPPPHGHMPNWLSPSWPGDVVSCALPGLVQTLLVPDTMFPVFVQLVGSADASGAATIAPAAPAAASSAAAVQRDLITGIPFIEWLKRTALWQL